MIDNVQAQSAFHSLSAIRFKYQVGLYGPMPGKVDLTVGELGVLLDMVDELEDLRRSLVDEAEM